MRSGLRDIIVDAVHMTMDGHDTENFRGCTHPDCVELKRVFALAEIEDEECRHGYPLDEDGCAHACPICTIRDAACDKYHALKDDGLL